MKDIPLDLRQIIGEFLNAAVEDQRKAGEMLRDHPWLRSATWRLGESLMHFLAVENYPVGVKWMLENGFDVDTVNELGDTAFFEVVKIENYRMAQLLLEYGANPYVVSPTYGTLHELAELLQDDVMKSFANSVAPCP